MEYGTLISAVQIRSNAHDFSYNVFCRDTHKYRNWYLKEVEKMADSSRPEDAEVKLKGDMCDLTLLSFRTDTLNHPLDIFGFFF